MKVLNLQTTYESYLTDADGVIQNSPYTGQPIRVAVDQFSGERYAKICDQLPDGSTAASREKREAIIAEKPLHFSSEVPGFNGYWVPAPEAVVAAPTT